jgi:hypothetical protein
MPDTLTSLFLFLVLLLPGFAYLVGRERNSTERQLSAFREPAVIVVASVTSELFVLIVFAAVRTLWPSITPDVGALIHDAGTYIRGGSSPQQPAHYRLVAVWGVGLLVSATGLAYLAALPSIRDLVNRPHESTMSAWWVVFEKWRDNRNIEIACMLDDGSAIRGQLVSFNRSADDSPERDLVLQEPLYYRPPGEKAQEVPWDASVVCLSASRIVSMFVGYIEVDRQSATPALAAGAAVQPPSQPTAVQSAEETSSETQT